MWFEVGEGWVEIGEEQVEVSGIVLVDCHYYYSVINSKKNMLLWGVYNVLTITMWILAL